MHFNHAGRYPTVSEAKSMPVEYFEMSDDVLLNAAIEGAAASPSGVVACPRLRDSAIPLLTTYSMPLKQPR